MAEKDLELGFECGDQPDEEAVMLMRLRAFAAELAEADEIQIVVVGDESQGKGSTTDPGATCDRNLTRIQVMFKPCVARLTKPIMIQEEKTFVARNES